MTSFPFATVVALLIISYGVHANGTSLIFELPDKVRSCFGQRFEGPLDYIFEYRVLRGGKNDVDVSVKSPNGKVLYKKHKMKEGVFKFETSRGDYSFCFSNEFSTFTHKLVFFDLKPADVNSLAGEAGVVKPFARTAFETSCEEVHAKMTSVVEYQRDYRLKEAIGRHLAEALRTHVTWWSIGQAVVVMLTGFGQVFILKRFFTEKVSDILIKEET